MSIVKSTVFYGLTNLYTSTHYPANYGFIPLTYADDDDPLDVLVLCSEEIIPMTIVDSYPIGVIKMIDNGKPGRKNHRDMQD